MTFLPLIPTVLTPVVVPVLPDPAAAIFSVAEALQPDLAQGFQIDALRLRLEMERYQHSARPCRWGSRHWRQHQITARDLVLEPSAGTGLLVILVEIAGGRLALNELADTRADLLRRLFPDRPVTGFDAAQIDDHLDAGLRPSVIVMNPPFSAVAHVDTRSTEATARHLRSALARLAPGGRLVAITGAGFAPDAPAWYETFDRLTESAHLVFTGAVSGAAFAKHGTSFETRISVFDKCRGGERGGITADLRQPMPSCSRARPWCVLPRGWSCTAPASWASTGSSFPGYLRLPRTGSRPMVSARRLSAGSCACSARQTKRALL